jgi:hypothetical protein
MVPNAIQRTNPSITAKFWAAAHFKTSNPVSHTLFAYYSRGFRLAIAHRARNFTIGRIGTLPKASQRRLFSDRNFLG